MAKIPEKDLATYSKERDGFLRDLQHFHETRGTPFRRCPILGGKEIDLHLLYSLVTAQGGWIKVNSKNTWPDILAHFRLPKSCVNGAVALKQIYLRYLDRWEKVHFLGEEAERGSDDDEESRHKRWSARALHSVPYTYNYAQHNVVETNREYNHLSTNLYKPSDYDRLALSLISPLPNEQDFAINVCTLLSNDGRHTLKLEKHPRIIHYLLGHAGIYHHSSLRFLFNHFYSKIRDNPIHNFWTNIIDSPEFLRLSDEDKAPPTDSSKDAAKPDQKKVASESEPVLFAPSDVVRIDLEDERLACASEVSAVDLSDSSSDCEMSISDNFSNNNQAFCDRNFSLNVDPPDRELFCLGRTLGTQDYVSQRVLQIATIMRNLSYIEENISVMVENRSFLRFLLLCATSRWSALRNLGLDMLGNVAVEFVVKDLQCDEIALLLLRVVTRGLQSSDRACCISSLEVLNKLSQNERNEDILLRCLESGVYQKVCSFLSIHDVMLLIYTLECLYSLSSLGERSCSLIANIHGVIDTLVSLVTVEGKSYGPKACIGMKLVETVSGGTGTQPSQDSTPSSSATATTTSTTPAVTTASEATSVSPAKTVQASTPVKSVSVIPQRVLQLGPATVTTPAVTVTTTSPTTTATQSTVLQTLQQPSQQQSAVQQMTPQQLIQQQHAHQQAIHENEQFALTWLRATYEPAGSGKIDHQELYKHYINSCSKIGRRGVISPLHFPRCVRSVFGGTVGPNPMKPTNANDPQYYEGIRPRPQPLMVNFQTNSSSNTQATKAASRRKPSQNMVVTPSKSPSLTVIADSVTPEKIIASPASPILKAQLSAPPKQRETVVTATGNCKSEAKNQVLTHPHLSQALMGTTSCIVTTTSSGQSKDVQPGQTSTSLIKSLLATKVNDCMTTTVSMKTATDCQNVAQVAARQQQQRLLAQQVSIHTPEKTVIKTESVIKSEMIIKTETPKTCRLNGARQLFPDMEIGDPSVSSTTQFGNSTKGKKEPPQPPPPPLVPLSVNSKLKNSRFDNEDSDSVGNNSLASSTGMGTVGIGGISSTEEGENSLTSFEGLLNGIPNIDNPLNEDSNSKDSEKTTSTDICKNKPLRLADLLEKKFEKGPLLLNGTLGRDLKREGLDLVENHIEKALCRDSEIIDQNMEEIITIKEEIIEIKDEPMDIKPCIKREAEDDIFESESKKPMLSSNVNGSFPAADSPAPDSVSSSNGEESSATVSTAAAKLFADIAADILEDEDEEQLLQEAQATTNESAVHHVVPASPLQQIIVDNNQQMLLSPPRQIIVSQAQMQQQQQVVISAGAHLKQQQTSTVLVQNASQQRAPVMLQQANTGQFIFSQGLQGQVQLVTSQSGQYLLQSGGAQGTYMVAQPQAAVVHGQPQTVLVAQTSQQQGTGAKTIIILQQQPVNNAATHHQKVVVTPQGQQVVVTQVPRPVVHTSSVTGPKVIKSAGIPAIQSAAPPTVVVEKRPEEVKASPKPSPKLKIVRDLTTPFVCEWGDCGVETRFKSANEVYMHACEAHCPSGSEEIVCQWDRCDNMKRKRFSLMTHLHDKHCNLEVMKQNLVRRKQNTHSSKAEQLPPPSSTSVHPGYAPDAALHAIKRHALEFVNPKELQDDNEGPVTKSIRLTASLILRNLVIYNSSSRRYLKHYEPHLANVALSNVESSRTIAQVLYDMNEGSNLR